MSGNPWGAALIGGGNLIKTINGIDAKKKQNSILTQGARSQSRGGQEAARVTGDAFSDMLRMQPNPAQEMGSFHSSLGSGAVSLPPTASPKARAAAAGATTSARGYGRDLGSVFSQVRAPQNLQRQYNYRQLDASNALRPITMHTANDAYLAQFLANMKQPNPWVDMVGDQLVQGGKAMMGGGK